MEHELRPLKVDIAHERGHRRGRRTEGDYRKAEQNVDQIDLEERPELVREHLPEPEKRLFLPASLGYAGACFVVVVE